MGYLGQDGILEGTEYDKYNFRINTTSSLLKDRLKISTNVAGYSGVKTTWWTARATRSTGSWP